jgi:hypothetical protein
MNPAIVIKFAQVIKPVSPNESCASVVLLDKQYAIEL